MEGVKIVCQQIKLRPLSPPVIEMSQNTGLLLDNTLIHIPDSETPPPGEMDNSNQVPSSQVPMIEPISQMQVDTPAGSTPRNNNNNNNGAFRLQDSAMPFDANFDQKTAEKPNARLQTQLSTDSQHKAAKKMKKEIHATTATGTLPLRKINKRDATELDFKNAPKAPRSAYQIYLYHRKAEISKEQGKPIKITNEIVRQIGTEWSSLPKKSSLKASFENKAEEDKQRYLKELANFLKTEPYLEFLRGKSDGGPVKSIDEYIAREQDTLNCLICNQVFSTSHNKKEHLLGRGHLLKLMNGFDEFKSDKPDSQAADANETTTITTKNEVPVSAQVNSSILTPSANQQYSPLSFRDNLHTDSSNATTEDYWNSPNRSTLTPEIIGNNQLNNPTFTNQQQPPCHDKARTVSSSSSVPSQPSPAINHIKDALFGAMENSSEEQPMANANFNGAGLLFDVDPEGEKGDFDMSHLDLPDDFNITHDYLNDLQSSKIDQIPSAPPLPSIDYQNTTPEQTNMVKLEPTWNQHGTNMVKLERQGSIESYASSAGDSFPVNHVPIPNVTNEISFKNEPAQQQFPPQQQQPQQPSQTAFLADLQSNGADADLSQDLVTFIMQQRRRDDELTMQRAAATSLQQTNLALQSEFEKLSQTRVKMEKDNQNLGEYGLSLQMQIQNLRNLPLMIMQSRNNAVTPNNPALNGIIGGGAYGKSPQSGDSPQGDANSSPSTYCESSITSPMMHHVNGLTSPLTASLMNSGVTNNAHLNVFPNYINNNHHQSVSDIGGHNHHSMFSATNALHHRGPNSVDLISSPMPYQGHNVLNGPQWTGN